MALGVICPIKNTLCQDRCHAARRLQQIISASSSGQSNVWKRLFRRTFVLGGHFILTENDAAPDAMSFRRVPCYLVNLAAFSKVSRDGKDELQFSAHYVAETFIKNCSDCLLEPIFGKLSGRKRP